ncbi:MAG: hypothetical protein IJQ67_00110 [Bacilli bacterium]|nr:hypothetical protein [Bacilli bacterium]
MPPKKSKISKLFDKYLAKMDALKKEGDAPLLYNELVKGKNAYMRIDRLATSSFDLTWIDAIEDVLFDLGDIVKNPREVTKTEAVLVPVELARKISSESVIHLASHTQYIKTVDENGDVIPNKIINIANEEDIHTYENRFIATLIRRLVLFIEKRYEFIKTFAPLQDEQILYFKNNSVINGAEVEIETKIKVRGKSGDSVSIASSKFISRIEDIRQYVLYYYSSQFMKKMKVDRDVRNPIIMTNILRKNPKYHRCYELYRFIEKYQQLGVDYRVNENVSLFSDEEIDELNTVAFTNYLALRDKDHSIRVKSLSKTYKPKILTSLDDEQFIYDDLLKGPFSFVRVDDPYQAYLDSKLKKDLPAHPTKVEREYYKEELAAKKENKEDKNQLEKLKKRKNKEAFEYEKKVQKIIAQREKEEELRRQREAEAARREEERRLDEIRRQIIAQARGEELPREENQPEEAEATEARDANREEAAVERDYHDIEPREQSEDVESIFAEGNEGEQRSENPEVVKYIDSLFDKLGLNDDTVVSPLTRKYVEDVEPVEEIEGAEEIALRKGRKFRQKDNPEVERYIDKVFKDLENEEEPSSIYLEPKKVRKLVEGDIKPIKEEDDVSAILTKKGRNVKRRDNPDVVKDIDSSFENSGDENIAPISIPEKRKRQLVEGDIAPISDSDIASIFSIAKKARKNKDNPEVVKYIDQLFDKNNDDKEVEAITLDRKKERKHYDFADISIISDDEDISSIFSSDTKESKLQDDEDIIKYVDSLFEGETREIDVSKFIVLTPDGYYCGKDKFSENKEDAYVFTDFDEAFEIKRELGGKVVRL